MLGGNAGCGGEQVFVNLNAKLGGQPQEGRGGVRIHVGIHESPRGLLRERCHMVGEEQGQARCLEGVGGSRT